MEPITLLAILIQTLAFYCLYNTSKRVEINKNTFSVWLQRHTPFSRLVGLTLMLLSFALLVVTQGLVPGIFIGVLSLMTFGSLIILLAPLAIKKQ